MRFGAQACHSNGGSDLLRACNRTLGLTDTLAAGEQDPRQLGKITQILS